MSKITLFRRDENPAEFKQGETIFKEGDDANVMYAVIEGSVALYHNNALINTLEADEIFGEMALCDNSPRSASAVAATDCKLSVVDQQRFEFLVQQTPHFAVQVMSIMAARLRDMTKLSTK